MPDSTMLPGAEGGGSSKKGGTNWLLMGGLGVLGLVMVLYMLNKGGSSGASSSGTTAAGTSINAALGSIQEQQLNAMGLASQQSADLSSQLSGVNGNVITGNQGVSTIAGMVATNGADAASNQQTILDYFKSLTTQVAGVGGQVSGVNATQAQQATMLSVLNEHNNSIDAALGGLKTGQSQAYYQAAGNSYIGMANATAATAGANDPRVVQWLQAAQAAFGLAG